jgi:hypothetical protein
MLISWASVVNDSSLISTERDAFYALGDQFKRSGPANAASRARYNADLVFYLHAASRRFEAG